MAQGQLDKLIKFMYSKPDLYKDFLIPTVIGGDPTISFFAIFSGADRSHPGKLHTFNAILKDFILTGDALRPKNGSFLQPSTFILYMKCLSAALSRLNIKFNMMKDFNFEGVWSRLQD